MNIYKGEKHSSIIIYNSEIKYYEFQSWNFLCILKMYEYKL